MRLDAAHAAAVKAHGFTIVEVLIAASLVMAVAAALAGFAHGMQRSFDRSMTSSDLTARARAGIAVVAADLHSAGSGISIGSPRRDLADLTPTVLPHRSLDNPSVAPPFTAVTIARATGAQGVLRDAALAGTSTLQLDPAAPSIGGDGTAGLRRGDVALVFDSSRAETVVIDAVDAAAWSIALSAPLRARFERGAFIAAIERTAYGLRRDASGVSRLVRRTDGGSEQPVVDHVTTLEMSLWGVAEPPLPAAHTNGFPSYGPVAPALGVDDERDTWPAGENCTLSSDGAASRLPRLAQRGPAGTLIELTAGELTDGPWCPDAADPEAFDADLLRLRQIDLRIVVDVSDRRSRVPAFSLVVSSAFRQR